MAPSMRVLFAAVALFVASLGCAATQPPLTPPSRGGAPWAELVSTHFRLRTDVDAATATRALHDLEESHAVLALAMQRPPHPGEPPIDVVLFARPQDFGEMPGAGRSGGYYSSSPSSHGVIVLADSDLPEETRRTSQHELSHCFLHERFPNPPVWLDEGLAEYYSSARRDGDRVVLGGPASVDFSDRTVFWAARVDTLTQIEVPRGEAPPVTTLAAADRAAFYALSEEGWSLVRGGRRAANYASAWRLVHLFMNGTDARYHAAFVSYLEDLQRGANALAAFDARFGPSLPQLEVDYRTYLTESGPRLVAVRGPGTASSESVAPRAMPSAEVEQLWSRLTSMRPARPELDRPTRPRR
jgi:hypothetical protein